MTNSTGQVSEASFYTEPLPFKVTKIFLYTTILIFGTVGNTGLILTICKFKYMKKYPGNLLILNLAVCDLLTPLISIPLDLMLVERNYRWHLGPAMCKVLPSGTTFIATSSALTLAAISLDRYRTLLHPFKQRLDSRTVKILIALVHICSGLLVFPHTVTLVLSPSGYCAEVWPNDMLPKMYTLVLFLGQYALPLTFMAVMYICTVKTLLASTERARLMSFNSKTSTGKRSINGSRNNSLSLNEGNGSQVDSSHESLERHFRKESEHNAQVTKMFIVIVVVFAVLTLPLEVLWMWLVFGGGDKNRYHLIIGVACRLFTYTNSCINPIIFYKFSGDFHRGFLAFCSGCAPCCGNDSALKRARLGATNGRFGTWDHNGRRIHTSPTSPLLTPKGSFHSAHLASFADQFKMSRDTKVEHNLSVSRFEHNSHSNSLAVEMFNRMLTGNKEDTDRKSDITNSLHGSVFKVPSTCTENILNNNCNITINVFFCDGDVAIEKSNLESLTVLPQTEC